MSRPLSHLTCSPRRTLTAAAAASLLAVAACGSGTTGSTTAAATTPPPAAAGNGTGAPMPSDMPSADAHSGMPGMGGGPEMAGGAHHPDPGKGLRGSEDGYRLVPTTTALSVGAQTISFRIQDLNGQPVTSYAVDQTKLLHFYLVRADLTGYVHDHPVLAKDGTWSIPVTVAAPGPYRMYADFVAKDRTGKDHPVVLSAPLTAAGTYRARPVQVPMRPGAAAGAQQSQTVDGLTVTRSGAIVAGTESKVSFQVSAGGRPVTDLEQYLDSFAHMTAIHAGDLAYQHVHPEVTARPGQRGGPSLPFTVELPEKGTWRLFLQVQRSGALHLVPFTVTVS